MRKQLLLSIVMLCFGAQIYAQAVNDLCDDAISLPEELSDWCSGVGAFTNEDATPTNWTTGAPDCQSGAQNDVWFTFVAMATDVIITVRGNTNTAPGGSLRRPEVTLFGGSCSNFSTLECTTDNRGDHIVELYKGGLFVGQTYIVQIQGRNGNEGTFQLCINNYNAPSGAESDCPTSAVLCDKSSFSVQAVEGAGDDRREMDDASCFSNGSALINVETNSTWFTWICDQSGTLEFDLIPLSEDDDLDFVIYELPNGVGDCSDKVVLRCMASGDFIYPSPCMGPTGLRAGSTDDAENGGCQGFGDDNYLRPLDMVSGRAYALAINNFTSRGNGFSLDFGGTGTFVGPNANFEVQADIGVSGGTLWTNEPVVITDLSSFSLGNIASWEWYFGNDATPITASGPGPHRVQYSTCGIKSVTLQVETNLGCKITEIRSFEVFSLRLSPQITAPDCNGGTNGVISLEVTGGKEPYQFSWEGAAFEEGQNTLDNLTQGDYSVRVIDVDGCETSLTVELREAEFTLDSSVEPVIPPSCFGLADGVIQIAVLDGVAPYEYDFGNGFTSENTISNVAAGVYEVDVRDAVGCDQFFLIEVGQPDSIQANLEAINISCFGQSDGQIIANASGGEGGYTYEWSNNLTNPQNDNLVAGTYTITVTDASGCTRTDVATIEEPLGVEFNLVEIVDALCFNEASGRVLVEALGGTPPFEFSTDGQNYQDSPDLMNLGAGDYTISVRDSRGCLNMLEATIDEPDPFFVEAGEEQTIELGFTARLNALTNPPGLPVTISWSDSTSLDCFDCPNPLARPFESTNYTITIEDENGCTAEDEVLIKVIKSRPIYEPNAFSPDGKDDNNTFTLFGGPAASQMNSFKIFNRWGELVYEGYDLPLNDPTVGWDGTYKGQSLNPAVFTYFAEILFVDGETRFFEGDVTLIR